jgi:UDP-N-acetylglucosamine 2-epimerase (non-hydrolysing)
MNSRLCIVIGTRAQLIKTAPVMLELQQRKLPYWFLYTAQHRDTIQDTIAEFGLKQPDHTLLDWSSEAKTIALFGSWGVRAFLALRKARRLVPFRKGIVMVHGDTASTLWGAVLGRFSGNRVLHLESGLRSFNLLHPFPEELVRVLTFRLSHIYACPGAWAVDNLKQYRGTKLNTHHNTIVDALRFAVERHASPAADQDYVVFSIHRFENLFNDARLRQVAALARELSARFRVKFVLHPATRRQLEKAGLFAPLDRIETIDLMDRLSYTGFMGLVAHAAFVVTDGGSNQEELSYLGVPTLIFRRATERVEGIGENAVLSAYDPDTIRDFVDGYQRFRRDAITPDRSPSAMIVDWLAAALYGAD